MDFQILDQGSLIGFRAITQEAKDWWEENVLYDDYQIMGDVVWCEHRMAQALFATLDDNGFKLGV